MSLKETRTRWAAPIRRYEIGQPSEWMKELAHMERSDAVAVVQEALDGPTVAVGTDAVARAKVALGPGAAAG